MFFTATGCRYDRQRRTQALAGPSPKATRTPRANEPDPEAVGVSLKVNFAAGPATTTAPAAPLVTRCVDVAPLPLVAPVALSADVTSAR